MATIYRISMTQAKMLIKILNMKDLWAEDIQRYLNKSQVKSQAKVKSATGIKGVWVSDERKGLTVHNTIEYNAEYQKLWGNQNLYGNVLIVLSDKAWATLPEEYKLSTEQVKSITF